MAWTSASQAAGIAAEPWSAAGRKNDVSNAEQTPGRRAQAKRRRAASGFASAKFPRTGVRALTVANPATSTAMVVAPTSAIARRGEPVVHISFGTPTGPTAGAADVASVVEAAVRRALGGARGRAPVLAQAVRPGAAMAMAVQPAPGCNLRSRRCIAKWWSPQPWVSGAADCARGCDTVHRPHACGVDNPMALQVGPAPWGCVVGELYAQSLKLVGHASGCIRG